jgi:hypothetical protein
MLIGTISLYSWYMASQSFTLLEAPSDSYPSPIAVAGLTPSDISVFSPTYHSNTPRSDITAFPTNAPTPTVLAVSKKVLEDRALLLIQGRNKEFFRDMSMAEKRYLVFIHKYNVAKKALTLPPASPPLGCISFMFLQSAPQRIAAKDLRQPWKMRQ